MAVIQNGPLIQQGFIKLINIDDGLGNIKQMWLSTVTGKTVPLDKYLDLAAEVAALGINEANILTGKMTDPYRI